MTKAYIEHDGGFLDIAAVVQVNYSAAQGGTVAVSTQHAAEGDYGQVVARLEPLHDPAASAAALPSEDETRELTHKMRGIAASLTLAMSNATAAAEKDDDGNAVYFVRFGDIWEVEKAVDTPGTDPFTGLKMVRQ